MKNKIYTLKDILPTASLRTSVIVYCKRRGKTLPKKRVKGVSYCMIDSSTLAWLFKELEALASNPYHSWYAPCGLQLVREEIERHLGRGA